MTLDEENAEILKWFRYIAPEYETLSEDEFFVAVEYWRPFVGRKAFGPFYTRALAYYTAHKIKFQEAIVSEGSDEAGLIAGQTTSKREGDLSISWGGTSSGDGGFTDDLDKTVYGIMFKRIRSMCIFPALTRWG